MLRSFIILFVGLFASANAGHLFNYKAITNGGGNRFWVTKSCEYYLAGADVRGREMEMDTFDWFDQVAILYDSSNIISRGSINGCNPTLKRWWAVSMAI